MNRKELGMQTIGIVLNVGNDQVDVVVRGDRGEAAAQQIAPRTPDNVADEEQVGHADVTGIGMARPRRFSTRGNTTRRSPASTNARARPASTEPDSRMPRAKGPELRSAT